jgi:hypothetical protein
MNNEIVRFMIYLFLLGFYIGFSYDKHLKNLKNRKKHE